MSVQTSTSRAQYAGNNSTSTPYPVPFLFLDNSHLRVVVTDSEGTDSPLVEGTDYTLTGPTNPLGGSFTTTAAISADKLVTVYREVPATQLTSYAENGEFPAASHERALDKLTMLVQQNTRTKGITLRLPDTRDDMPPLYPQASTVIGFDGSNPPNPITYDPAALVAFIGLQNRLFDSPTKTFLDAGARAAALPEFIGQVGVQVDDKSLWISNAVTTGAWQPVLSGTSYNNDAFVIVQTTTTAAGNGSALLAAYTAAKALTPGGDSLSATNRAVLIVPPGEYDLGSSELVLDTQFVDVIGMTTNRRAQYIHSVTPTSAAGTIRQTADDVVIQNLYLANFCNSDGSNSSATSAAYFPSSNLPNTKLRNIELYTLGPGGGPYATRVHVTYSGTYEDCYTEGVFAGGNNFGSGPGNATGKFFRVQGGDNSFGGGAGSQCAGTFYDCIGVGQGTFGQYGNGIGSGAVLINCRKIGGNLADSTTIAAGARIINLVDPNGVQFYPVSPAGTGGILQSVYKDNGDFKTFTNTMSLNDSIPTTSSGTEYTELAATITPFSASNKVRVRFSGLANKTGGAAVIIVAVFLGAGTDAIYATSCFYSSGTTTKPDTINFEFVHAPASTSALTYKIRVGADTGNIHFNGGSVRLFGGVAKTTLILEEIKA